MLVVCLVVCLTWLCWKCSWWCCRLKFKVYVLVIVWNCICGVSLVSG